MLRALGGAPILAERTNNPLEVGPFIPDLKLSERDVGDGITAPVLVLPSAPVEDPSTSFAPLPLGEGVTSAAAAAAAASGDPLTPRLLAALEALDQGAERLAALSPRASTPADVEEEPEWLREASAFSQALEDEHGGVAAALVTAATMGFELRVCEAHAAHHQACAEAQVRAMAEISSQLAITKDAAQSTAAAARLIVEDHESDVSLLLAELRRFDPDAAEDIQLRLSAPMVALSARRRQAAKAAPRASPARDASPILERISRTASEVGAQITRSLSFGPRGRATRSPRARATSPFCGRA